MPIVIDPGQSAPSEDEGQLLREVVNLKNEMWEEVASRVGKCQMIYKPQKYVPQMTYIEISVISVIFSNSELQAEHSEEKGFQCDAKPVQCVQFVDTYSFKAANSSSMLMRNLTNSSNFRRLSLLPGLI